MRRGPSGSAATVLVVAVAVLAGAGCAGQHPLGAGGRRSPSAAAIVTAGTTTPAALTSGTARARRTVVLPGRLIGIGNAQQLISVESAGYHTGYATLRAYEHTSSGWRRVFGPWPARIGRNGFAPPGRKREGDGRTPTGSFGFQFLFGVDPNPGVRFHYRRALRTSWWDDDSASPYYNEWVDSRYRNPGRSPESMDQTPAYNYGAVIAYNTARKPGLGSAIFLHVSHVGPTAGCVSIAQSRLLAVLRWLRPAAAPRIVMGPTSVVTR